MTRQGKVPLEVVLPFDYRITVLRVPVEGNAWGDWDPDTRTIRVDKDLRQYAQARYIFLHEMEHAWKDWLRYVATKIGIDNPDGPIDEPSPNRCSGTESHNPNCGGTCGPLEELA